MSKKITRRAFAASSAAAAAVAGFGFKPALAQAYPARPVTVIVPWGAGGGTDATARIVAALLDTEATVKTFKRTKDQVWLLPHNPAYAPIPGDEATVLGRVVTVLRKV